MRSPQLTKYVYQIRSRNGGIVDNLQIYGRTEEESRRKLLQMHTHCEILRTSILKSETVSSSSFEDVLDLIAQD